MYFWGASHRTTQPLCGIPWFSTTTTSASVSCSEGNITGKVPEFHNNRRRTEVCMSALSVPGFCVSVTRSDNRERTNALKTSLTHFRTHLGRRHSPPSHEQTQWLPYEWNSSFIPIKKLNIYISISISIYISKYMHLRSLVCHSIHYTNTHTTLTRRYSNNAKCPVFTVSSDTVGFSNMGRWRSLFNDTQHQFKIHGAE